MLIEIPPNHRRQTLFRLPGADASLAEAVHNGQLRYVGTVDTLNGHGDALPAGLTAEYVLIDIGRACVHRGSSPDDATPLGELLGYPELDPVLTGEDATQLVRVSPGENPEFATRALGCIVLSRRHFGSVLNGAEALELQPRQITGLLVTMLAIAGETEIDPKTVVSAITAEPRA